MTIKQTNILLAVSCYATMFILMPIFGYWSEQYDNLGILMLLLPIEIVLILFPAWYSEHHLEKAKLPSEYVASSEPVLVIRNRFTHRDNLRIALSDLFWYVKFFKFFLEIKCHFRFTPDNICPCKNSLRLSFRQSFESIHIRPDKHSPSHSLPFLQ